MPGNPYSSKAIRLRYGRTTRTRREVENAANWDRIQAAEAAKAAQPAPVPAPAALAAIGGLPRAELDMGAFPLSWVAKWPWMAVYKGEFVNH